MITYDDDSIRCTKDFDAVNFSLPEPEVSVFSYTEELNDVFLQWSEIDLKSMVYSSSSKHLLDE